METILLQDTNYREWVDYIKADLMAKDLWNVVLGVVTHPIKPRAPTSPKSAASATESSGYNGTQSATEDESNYASDTPRFISALSAETPAEWTASGFLVELLHREIYLGKLGRATAEIRKSLHPSIRKYYAASAYDEAPTLLWAAIQQDRGYARTVNLAMIRNDIVEPRKDTITPESCIDGIVGLGATIDVAGRERNGVRCKTSNPDEHQVTFA
jgi:hypothetical protein